MIGLTNHLIFDSCRSLIYRFWQSCTCIIFSGTFFRLQEQGKLDASTMGKDEEVEDSETSSTSYASNGEEDISNIASIPIKLESCGGVCDVDQSTEPEKIPERFEDLHINSEKEDETVPRLNDTSLLGTSWHKQNNCICFVEIGQNQKNLYMPHLR